MLEYDPPPLLHITTFVSLVLIPYIDDVLILIMGMNGGRMGGVNMPFGRDIIHVSYATFFRENIGKTMIASLDVLLPCGMRHLHLMRTWEENFMEGLIGRHLAYEESLSHAGVTNGGGEEFEHSPLQFLEEKQHLGGGTVIFPISHELVGILIFVFSFLFNG